MDPLRVRRASDMPPPALSLLGQHSGVVELRMPVRATSIHTVRAAAGDLATRAAFCPGTVSDLRMAVDEASTTAVAPGSEDRDLYCGLVLGQGRMEVVAKPSSPSAYWTPPGSAGGSCGRSWTRSILAPITRPVSGPTPKPLGADHALAWSAFGWSKICW